MCRHSEKSVCSSVAVAIMVCVNILFLLVAIGIVGGGAYLFINYEGFEDVISQDALIYAIIAGAILFFLSLLAIYGSVANNKVIIGIYLVCIVLMVSSQVIIAILGLQYIGELQALGGNSTLASKTEQVINDFMLRSYNTCCVKDADNCPTVLSCTKVFGCDFDQCSITPPCDSGICISGNAIESEIEPVDVGVCSALEAFDLVGAFNATGSPCGGGDPEVFLNSVLDKVAEDFNIAGYVLIGLGGLELILIFISVYLVFGKQNNYYSDQQRYAVAVGEALDPFEVDMDSVRDSISIAPPALPNGRARGRSNVGSTGSYARSSFDGAFESVRDSARMSARSSARMSAQSSVRSSIDRRTMQNNPSSIDDVL